MRILILLLGALMKKFKGKGCGIPTDQWECSCIPLNFFSKTQYTFVYVPLQIFHFFYLLEFIVLQFLLWPLQIVTVWTAAVCIGK